VSDDIAGLIDVATAPEAAAPAATTPTETTAPEIDAPDQTLDTPDDVSSESGSESPEDSAQPQDSDVERSVDARTNPAAVRAALKAMRDSDPALAPIARQLNDAYGRYTAYRNVFPKVADAQQAKALIDAVGGGDGLTSLQENVKAIQATDAKLYAGDASVLDDIIEDMRSEGKIDAFGKLAPGFLEKLRSVDEKAYFAAMKPHFFQGLNDVGFANVVDNVLSALSGEQPNVAGAKQVLQQMASWFQDLKSSVDSASKQNLDPDRQAFEKERSDFRSQQQQAFNTDCAAACDQHNNDILGQALRKYTRDPFFKNMDRDAWMDVGGGVKQALLRELSQDKSYQSQMDAFFSQKSPDKAKIAAFHKAQVEARAQRIVRDLINRRYPGFKSKAVARPQAKPAAQPQATGAGFQWKQLTSRPEWGEIDWSEPGAQNAYIVGKAKLKNGQYVQWGGKPKR
jgi:hypothetical protein